MGRESDLEGYQTFDVALDYRTKRFNYSSDDYTTSYLSTTRCVGRDQQANIFVGTLIATTGEKGEKLITAERPTLVEREGK